jgi:cytochrome c oxidase cbb3-type subunit 1
MTAAAVAAPLIAPQPAAAQPVVARPVAYTDDAVRGFALASIVWGVVGMLVGVVIAAQLAFPDLGYGIPWLSYGRLRPCTPTP